MPYADPISDAAKASMARRNKAYYDKNKERLSEYFKKKNKKYYESHKDELCEQSREWAKNNRAKKREHTKTYRSKHPQKFKAQQAVQKRVARGTLKKRPCLICQNLIAEAHHPDYSRPLDVIWLCDKHHKEIHKLIDTI